MDLIETPLEAHVFRYSAALASSLWAWLAVLTAAFSLWRIRSSGSKPDNQNPTPKPTSPAQISPPASCHEEVPTPKARFTAYYCRDERYHVEEEVDGKVRKSGSDSGLRWESVVPDEDEVGVGGSEAMHSGSDWGFGWEKLTPVERRVDSEWYRYQDITVLNGSVVRLWHGEVTTMRRRGRRV